MARTPKQPPRVETLRHAGERRSHIPTAELESVMSDAEKQPIQIAYARRNRDLDPQLVWRGKDEQDWSDLVVHAPPLYIQEKVHPKALIDDLLRQTREMLAVVSQRTNLAARPRFDSCARRVLCGAIAAVTGISCGAMPSIRTARRLRRC